MIINIEKDGEKAIKNYSEQFDKWTPKTFRHSEEEMAACLADLTSQQINDIKFAQNQVKNFAEHQRA
ncbi:histidinol dehydrogenase [Acinetobacter nectaris]|uniref:histidinol dehydrogenase n=1 Tax=Acinetobacter nectaris TaxID=1219382 RepID=UPI001F38C347|nr:histidinol dehydrogenase [Acinetobacter nectaris]